MEDQKMMSFEISGVAIAFFLFVFLLIKFDDNEGIE